jgi:hypothetical protein
LPPPFLLNHYNKVILKTQGGDKLPRTGRPTNNPKLVRLGLRLTPEQSETLQECADELETTRTGVIVKGIELVKSEIEEKKK